MSTLGLIVFYILYSLFTILYSLIWFSVYKGLEKIKNSTISSTAKLLAYRKGFGILISFPIVASTIILFLSLGGYINSLFAETITFTISLLIFIFTFTIYRKKVIELSDEIKKTNPAVGSVAQFFFGFSNFKEMLILFVAFIVGILFIFLLIWLLIKHNVI